MLELFVIDSESNERIPAIIKNAAESDLTATGSWHSCRIKLRFIERIMTNCWD